MVSLLSIFEYFLNLISCNSHRWLSGLELIGSCGSVAKLCYLMSCVSWDCCFHRAGNLGTQAAGNTLEKRLYLFKHNPFFFF